MKFLSDRLGFIRFYTWWNYKLPPLFGIAFFFILYSQLPFDITLQRLAVLIVCMIGTAGFGHYLNDIFDIEDDKRSGKPNSAARHSRTKRILILTVLLALGLLPWFLFYETGAIHFLVIAVFLLFVLYSVPPVRLKDKGFWGIFTDTLYAHAIPAVVVALAILAGGEITSMTRKLIAIVFFWQFFVGFRNIAFHQYADYEQDMRSGTKTWAVKLGADKMKKTCLQWIYPVEAAAFLIFLVSLVYVSILAGVLLILMIALRLYVYMFIYEKGYLANWRNYFSFVNNSYEEDIPLVMLICLTFGSPWFVLILALHCILFPEFFLRMQRI